MSNEALFVDDSDYNSDTKEYYILVILPALPGFQKQNSNAAYHSCSTIHVLHSLAVCFVEIFLHLLLVSINFPTASRGSNSVCKCCKLLTLQ